jgi:hypothetical protein
MSQTNSFQKSNNPNYIYFDLQQTNAYNNTAKEQNQLRFLETRDSPIVQNSGDYVMSVSRFQVDTYSLPVLVCEPYIDSPGTFDFTKLTYQVGIRVVGVELPSMTAPKLTSLGALDNYTQFSRVSWRPDNPSVQPPTAAGALTGKNTVLYPYYHCHSYDRFINFVNAAIKDTYIEMVNYLYTNLIPGVANRTNYGPAFLNVFLKQFPAPPFLRWSNFQANLIANALFTPPVGIFDTNYLIPGINWNVVGLNNIGTINKATPFKFQFLMNASLYALFNTYPATETIINNEKYFIIDFNFPQLTSISDVFFRPTGPAYTFDFDPAIFNPLTGIYTIPESQNYEWEYSNLYYSIPQEMSTIDTWCPINSIVFTTNTLPIIVNQASTVTTIGNQPPSAEVNSQFELIITDFQTNQQGFRPNVLYVPTSEYRRIDMTGNTPIQIIDISVLWRARTGQLQPFILPRGGSASLKILFEKKSLEQMK